MRDRFTLPPVGTIYWSAACERAWKVVKRTEKTLWLQELEVTRSRTAPPTISRSTVIGDVIMRLGSKASILSFMDTCVTKDRMRMRLYAR